MTWRRGGAVIVVLMALVLAASAARSETPVPAKTDAADPSMPSIVVRTGEHSGYTRIVFDWREAVDYQVNREGGHIRVKFNRPAAFDLKRLPPQPGRWIETIVTASTAEGALVRLGVDEGARLRHLRVGPKVVVDVFAPQRSPIRSTERKTPTAPVTAPDETAAPAASADSTKDQFIDLEPAALADSDVPATEPDTAPADAVSADAVSADDEAARDAAAGPAVSIIGSARELKPKRESAARQTPERVIRTLRFAWREPTAAAVFHRAGWIWIVFDRPPINRCSKPCAPKAPQSGSFPTIERPFCA